MQQKPEYRTVCSVLNAQHAENTATKQNKNKQTNKQTLLEICPATFSNEQCISSENHCFLMPNVWNTGCTAKHSNATLESEKNAAQKCN